MVRVGCGSCCAECQLVRGCRSGHCCSNSQGAGQEPCTQSFGEILGEGQRGLNADRVHKQTQEREERGIKRLVPEGQHMEGKQI